MADVAHTARAVQPLRSWVRENAAAVAVIVVMAGVWGFATGVVVFRVLGFRVTSIDNRPASAVENVRFFGDPAAINTLTLLAVLVALTVPFRVRMRVLPLAVVLALVGTGAAVAAAVWLHPIVHTNNWRGPDIIQLGAAPLGLAVAWVVWLVVLAFRRRYRVAVRVRVLRRGARPHSGCPHCAYDLSAASSATCPECGWTIPAGVLARAAKSGA